MVSTFLSLVFVPSFYHDHGRRLDLVGRGFRWLVRPNSADEPEPHGASVHTCRARVEALADRRGIDAPPPKDRVRAGHLFLRGKGGRCISAVWTSFQRDIIDRPQEPDRTIVCRFTPDGRNCRYENLLLRKSRIIEKNYVQLLVKGKFPSLHPAHDRHSPYRETRAWRSRKSSSPPPKGTGVHLRIR